MPKAKSFRRKGLRNWYRNCVAPEWNATIALTIHLERGSTMSMPFDDDERVKKLRYELNNNTTPLVQSWVKHLMDISEKYMGQVEQSANWGKDMEKQRNGWMERSGELRGENNDLRIENDKLSARVFSLSNSLNECLELITRIKGKKSKK